MDPPRIFIALDIPAAIQRGMDEAAADLRGKIGTAVKWIRAGNLHLTLKFLGDVSPADIQTLTDMLRAQADTCRPFDLQIGGLGAFPSPKRPRVIFIEIQAPAELEALHRGIESACTGLGFPPERRDFSPHLTIGRVRQHVTPSDAQNIRRALESSIIGSLGSTTVDSLHLYKSNLKPDGAVYTRLFSARFRLR